MSKASVVITTLVADRPSGFDRQDSKSLRRRRMQLARRGGAVLAGIVIVLSALAILTGATSRAHPPDPPSPPDPPPDSALIRPLAPITPTPSNWAPKFPFPYDQTRGNITDADISAQRELCQWYNAQYVTLRDQIDRLQFNRIAPNGTDYDYSLYGLQEQVDIVTGNIDQSLAFMEPRVRAFTQSRNHFGDVYFPLYEAEAFYKLWEQLSNVTDGIKAHQPNWFTGPSVQKAKRWGSDIHRSHVCDGA